MQNKIYLDNNATTAVDPRVIDLLTQTLQSSYGNPSSVHSFGQEARQQLQQARNTIASILGVHPHELIFTSGGTEALNMIIRGLLPDGSHGHIITSDGEHSSVYQTVKHLEKKGFSVSYLPMGTYGAVSPQAVVEAINEDTKLIALIGANNETGVKTDTDAIAQIAYQAGIPFLVDAVALIGKEPLKPIHKGISALCFSGHKIHAPKGIGLAFVRKQLLLTPLLFGGDQEYKRRAGTENMSGIIALAQALTIMAEQLPETVERMTMLRDRLEAGIKERFPSVIVNGSGPRVCNTSNLAFPQIDGESLLILLDLQGVAVSHGSACSSGALEPSRILLAMGLPLALARSSIRFSLSRFTTIEEIDRTINIITTLLESNYTERD